MKVSVYCLVYNHEKYIRDALEGFVNQNTNFDYEVIVHDDASTDQSAAIIKEYAEKYPQIIKPILQKENKYSQGIPIVDTFVRPHLSGEYVAICEGDDYWCDNNKLQMQVDFLDSHPDYSACVHNTLLKDLGTKKDRVMYNREDGTLFFKDVIQGGGAFFHTSSIMYRREFLDFPDFYKNAKGFGDYPLAIHLALSGKIMYFKQVMSVYRYGTPYSYSKRFEENDLRKNTQIPQNRIEMLKEVDRFTNGKYKELIDPVIVANEYEIFEMLEQYENLNKPPYLDIYKQKGIKYKCKLTFKKAFPHLYHYLRKKKYS